MRLDFIYYNYFYKPVLKFYLKFNTVTYFDHFKIKVLKGVFHPTIYFSSKYFYSFINNLTLQNKSFLEIGCGTGILSMLAQKKGATVTLLDIDPLALENSKINFKANFHNQQSPTFIESDVLENLDITQYDFIIINPPYFFKKVYHQSQFAWYCGQNGEFFVKLFQKLQHFLHQNTEAYMILADNCEIDRIKSIAAGQNFTLNLVDEKKIRWEINYIYKLKLNKN